MFREFQLCSVGGGGHYKTHHVIEQLSVLCKWTEPSGREPSLEWGVLALQQEESPAQSLPMPGLQGVLDSPVGTQQMFWKHQLVKNQPWSLTKVLQSWEIPPK